MGEMQLKLRRRILKTKVERLTTLLDENLIKRESNCMKIVTVKDLQKKRQLFF